MSITINTISFLKHFAKNFAKNFASIALKKNSKSISKNLINLNFLMIQKKINFKKNKIWRIIKI